MILVADFEEAFQEYVKDVITAPPGVTPLSEEQIYVGKCAFIAGYVSVSRKVHFSPELLLHILATSTRVHGDFPKGGQQ